MPNTTDVVESKRKANSQTEGVYVDDRTGHKIQVLDGFTIPVGYAYSHGLDEQPARTPGDIVREELEAAQAAAGAETDVALQVREAELKDQELAERERAVELQRESNELLEQELAARRAALSTTGADVETKTDDAGAKTAAAKRPAGGTNK